MAEVRKHRPRSAGSIGDQVRAAVPTGPAPIEPGAVPPPTFDPYVDADADKGANVATTDFASADFSTNSWLTLGDDAVDALKFVSETSVFDVENPAD